MKMIPDRTGRFPERLYYELDELEEECERIMEALLMSRYGQYSIPVPTDALVELLDRETPSSTCTVTLLGRVTRCTVSPSSSLARNLR